MRVILFLGLLLTIFNFATAEEPLGEAKNIYGVLMQALVDGDASVFQELGTLDFKKQMTHEKFEMAERQIGDRLRSGYRSFYLGKISKNNRDLFLWKVSIGENQEQLLATLVLENNKVGGFYFQ